MFLDESPTKQNKSKAWLWVAVVPMFAGFGIFLSRKREALQQLVGKYKGIIINCDRAKMYFDGKGLQWCWSHPKRDIQKLIDSPNGQVKRLGQDSGLPDLFASQITPNPWQPQIAGNGAQRRRDDFRFDSTSLRLRASARQTAVQTTCLQLQVKGDRFVALKGKVIAA